MNINNDYQKRRVQITSFTGEIIEPKRKYLESNSFYPPSNFLSRILGTIQENKQK